MKKSQKKTVLLGLFILILAGGLIRCGGQNTATDADALHWAEQTLSKLSLEEKIAQLICVDITAGYITEENPEFQNWVRLARDHGIGGFVLYGGTVPADPLYLRLFGGAATAWGVAYWLAYKDPRRNVAIIQAGLVDNALPTLAVVIIGLTNGISSLFIWISAAFTGIFFFLFLILMPREVQTGEEVPGTGAA